MTQLIQEKIKVIEVKDYRNEAREFIKTHFKDEKGSPIIFTNNQCDIFNLIAKKLYPRVHIETHTRYGKSLAVALGTLTRITTYPERFSIVAGTDKQAAIIMGYIIDHIFDDAYFWKKFQMPIGENEASIRRYKNKNRLNFIVYAKKEKGNDTRKDLMGEVFITNAKGALGFGAPNVILDEGALISDEEEALVFRMLGDQIENFYFKIGNPWESGHFRKSFEDTNYYKIVVDWKQGLRDNRISIDLVEEARKKPFFGVLYECKFPPRDTADKKGWTALLTKDDIDKALIDEASPFGINKLGTDVAGGGKNFSVVIQRHTNVAEILLKNHDPDTMNLAEKVLTFREDRLAGMDGVFIDATGEGKGVTDTLQREIKEVIPFNGAEKPLAEPDQDKFINIRAMCYWRLREWILAGGKLIKGEESLDATWYQLTQVKYSRSIERLRGKLRIMSKEDMAKEGIPSPDVADALMMTFLTEDEHLNIQEERPRQQSADEKRYEKYGLFPKV